MTSPVGLPFRSKAPTGTYLIHFTTLYCITIRRLVPFFFPTSGPPHCMTDVRGCPLDAFHSFSNQQPPLASPRFASVRNRRRKRGRNSPFTTWSPPVPRTFSVPQMIIPIPSLGRRSACEMSTKPGVDKLAFPSIFLRPPNPDTVPTMGHFLTVFFDGERVRCGFGAHPTCRPRPKNPQTLFRSNDGGRPPRMDISWLTSKASRVMTVLFSWIMVRPPANANDKRDSRNVFFIGGQDRSERNISAKEPRFQRSFRGNRGGKTRNEEIMTLPDIVGHSALALHPSAHPSGQPASRRRAPTFSKGHDLEHNR